MEARSAQQGSRSSRLPQRESVPCSEALASVFGLLGKRWTGGIAPRGGLVNRKVLPGPPHARMYRLTDGGAALEPGLESLARWAETHRILRQAGPGTPDRLTTTGDSS